MDFLMRRALGPALGLSMLALVPLTTACYAPRIEACRNSVSDFSSITSVEIVGAQRSFGFESASFSSYTIVAHTTDRNGSFECVSVHSELRNASGTVEVIDTPIRAHNVSGVITTTQMIHYHFAGDDASVHVTALGQTLDAALIDPFARPDARSLVFDGGPRDSGLAVSDAGGRDSSTPDSDLPDAALDDASTSDADMPDANVSDADMADADVSDADVSDADVDAGP